MPVIVFLLQSVNRCSRQQLRPQNCDSRFQSAVFKYAEFSSRSYAGCGGRTRRSAASAVRQHGNPEASRFFRKSRPKNAFYLSESVFAVARIGTIRLSVFTSGGYRGIIADGVSERGGYDVAAFSRNFERFSFYGELHRRAQKIFRACEYASDNDTFGI